MDSAASLGEVFKVFGPVESIAVKEGQGRGHRQEGYAFVEFVDAESLQKAVAAAARGEVRDARGTQLQVTVRKAGSRGGGRGRSRGRGGYRGGGGFRGRGGGGGGGRRWRFRGGGRGGGGGGGGRGGGGRGGGRGRGGRGFGRG